MIVSHASQDLEEKRECRVTCTDLRARETPIAMFEVPHGISHTTIRLLIASTYLANARCPQTTLKGQNPPILHISTGKASAMLINLALSNG